MSDTVESIIQEQKQAAFAAEIDALNEPTFEYIEKTAANAEYLASEILNAAPELGIVRNCAQSVKAAFTAYAEAARKIESDGGNLYTLQGMALEKAKLAAVRDEEVERAKALAEAHINAIGLRYPEQYDAPPSREIADEAQLILSRFPMMSGSGFMKEASDVLRRAADPATPEATRSRLNQLLRVAYQPLVERRSEAPEHHSRRLAPSAAKLNDAILKHLSINQKPSSVAKSFAQQIRQQLNFVATQFEKNIPRDYDLIEMQSELLYPKNESQWWNKS